MDKTMLVGNVLLSEKEIKIINAFHRIDRKNRDRHTFLLEFDGKKRYFLATNQYLLFVSLSKDNSPKQKHVIEVKASLNESNIFNPDIVSVTDITEDENHWGINTFSIGERYSIEETEVDYGFSPQFIHLISHCFTILEEDPVEVALTWLEKHSKKDSNVHPILSFKGKKSWAILMKKKKI